MVALLQILPDLDAPKHAAFIGVSAGAGSGISDMCAMCHGVAGQSDAAGTFPRLDLQSCEYLFPACRPVVTVSVKATLWLASLEL